MFLATTALREFWQADQGLLLLGPWCRGPEQAAMLTSPWDDRRRLDAAIPYCQDVHLRLIERLADFLNDAHRTRLSRRYWHILLGPWATIYVHTLYDRYIHAQEALRAHPGLTTLSLDPQDDCVAWDSLENVRLFHTDHYNLQLYSWAFRALGKDFPTRRHAPPNLSAPAAPRRPKDLVKAALNTACAWGAKSPLCDILMDEVYPMAGGQRLALMSKLGFRAWPLLKELPPGLRRPAESGGARRRLATLAAGDDFEKLAAACLPSALPTLYLEGFAQARTYAAASLGRTPLLVLAGSWIYYQDHFRLAAAQCVERGARLLGFQHGGQYRTARVPVGEAHERAISDVFLTWGWSATQKDDKLRDVPVPNLSALPRRAPLSQRSDILVVTTNGMANPHHLYHMPQGRQWEDFFSWLERFLVAAAEGHKAELCLRLLPKDYGWGLRPRLQARFPDLRLDSHGVAFHKRLLDARLVVTDHPGTPFLETLALDVPSLHFWQRDRWETSPDTEPYFEALRAAGIVHDDPESAARKLSEVCGDPEAWWAGEAQRKARGDFARLFARTDPSWLEAWADLLSEEVLAVRAAGQPAAQQEVRDRKVSL